jgi:hypothetical protein
VRFDRVRLAASSDRDWFAIIPLDQMARPTRTMHVEEVALKTRRICQASGVVIAWNECPRHSGIRGRTARFAAVCAVSTAPPKTDGSPNWDAMAGTLDRLEKSMNAEGIFPRSAYLEHTTAVPGELRMSLVVHIDLFDR